MTNDRLPGGRVRNKNLSGTGSHYLGVTRMFSRFSEMSTEISVGLWGESNFIKGKQMYFKKSLLAVQN